MLLSKRRRAPIECYRQAAFLQRTAPFSAYSSGATIVATISSARLHPTYRLGTGSRVSDAAISAVVRSM
jgi:hypothetical protein